MEIGDKQIAKLREKFPHIVRWSRMMQSFDYYIDNQVVEAEADNAPTDAIYKTGDSWRTLRDLAEDHPFRQGQS